MNAATTTEARAIPPHLVAEFYTWLWWSTEKSGGRFDLGGDLGKIELWIDDRLSFRTLDANKPATVMTGDNPSVAKEAKAALAGGKLVHDLRVSVRRDDREFCLTLDGATMDLKKAKLPQAIEGSGEEALMDRMFLYEEITAMITALFKQFATARTSPKWGSVTVPQIREWIGAEKEA